MKTDAGGSARGTWDRVAVILLAIFAAMILAEVVVTQV